MNKTFRSRWFFFLKVWTMYKPCALNQNNIKSWMFRLHFYAHNWILKIKHLQQHFTWDMNFIAMYFKWMINNWKKKKIKAIQIWLIFKKGKKKRNYNFTGRNIMAIIMKVCKYKFINHIMKVLLIHNIHFIEIQ